MKLRTKNKMEPATRKILWLSEFGSGYGVRGKKKARHTITGY